MGSWLFAVALRHRVAPSTRAFPGRYPALETKTSCSLSPTLSDAALFTRELHFQGWVIVEGGAAERRTQWGLDLVLGAERGGEERASGAVGLLQHERVGSRHRGNRGVRPL